LAAAPCWRGSGGGGGVGFDVVHRFESNVDDEENSMSVALVLRDAHY
jgi:hypothetical protein